jgi:alpha-L-fucosidase
MHLPGHSAYKHHLEKYGHPSKFGYHDFVPMFKAEKFDPEEWADLFEQTGARFAGPVAEHHDGFSMWDSDVTPWNVKDMGPKRDVTGELAAALRKRGMKLITTFHHARHLQRYDKPLKEEGFKEGNRVNSLSHYPFFEGMPPTSEDPKLRMLYGNLPEDEWLEKVWFGKLKEVIDKYQPDMIWFDSWLDRIPEEYREKFCAYYLNDAAKRGKEVVILRKQDDMPIDFTVLDHEKSRMSGASEHVWMTDDTISRGSWCYTSDLTIKPAADIIHALADTVSKNGIVLLNISPKADGSIPEDQRETLKGIGDWMKVNGEAIYATRPWVTFGEGPTKEPAGGFGDAKKFLNLKYSYKDIRFTQSKDGKTVYAIMLGWPKAEETVVIKSLGTDQTKIAGVSLLGCDAKIEWKQTADGLTITVPDEKPSDAAVAFKVAVE